MSRAFSIVLAVALPVFAAEAAKRNVFFAGGQSNAKAVWASAIAGGLQPGFGSTLVMAWTNHSGEGLANWFTTAPKANYSNDLFNAAGTGLLQAQIQAITNAGDQAVFQGFFWFQGETDTGSYDSMDAYTNRFKAMMAQLKLDLGLTNDVRFMLAVIDANQDPGLDDDLAAIGRTHAMVDYLRTNQINLCSCPQGSCVDTRSYSRGTDVWHLPTDELTRLGLAMSAAFTNTFGTAVPPAETVDLISHTADGAIYSTSTFIDQSLICGVSGTVMYNGISFFKLPTNRIEEANLTLTVDSNYGPLTSANIDIWALGYMSTPAMNSAWLATADIDTRALINNNVPFTKIADNIITMGQTATVGSVWQLNASQRTNLTAYLNSLYEKGALPGDYVVIRVNPDASFTAAQNIRFGSSREASARQAKLTLTLSGDPAPSATEGTVQIYSHPNDGGVYAGGVSTLTDLISGTGGAGPTDWSGIAFFALPEQPMSSVSISLPVTTFSGVMSNANIDVWGLGYQSVPTLSTTWFCTNNTGSTPSGVSGLPPLKLADNIVTSGQSSVSGNVWRPTASQCGDLRRYLNGLYLKGAKPGDYAVIRVNMDASQYGFVRGVRWGGSQQASPANRASMSFIYPLTTNRLVNAGFETGSGTSATGWSVLYNNFLGQRTNATPRSGSSAFRFAVNGDQSTNTANNINISQDVAIAGLPNRCVTFSFNARHNSDEPLVTNSNQKVEARMWWLNGATTLGFVDGTSPLVPTDTKDAYRQVLVSGVAPTNSTGVRAMVIFRSGTGTGYNPAITNGAAIVDDLRLTVFAPDYPDGSLIQIK